MLGVGKIEQLGLGLSDRFEGLPDLEAELPDLGAFDGLPDLESPDGLPDLGALDGDLFLDDFLEEVFFFSVLKYIYKD